MLYENRIALKYSTKDDDSMKKVLLLYNGSTTGHLSGGEYAYSKIRNLLEKSFDVKAITIDDITRDFMPAKIRRLSKRLAIPFMILVSYLLYKRYDLVITSWSPKIPYYGDIVYVQPFSQNASVFGNPDSNSRNTLEFLMRFPNKLIAGPSRRRHVFIANSYYTKERLENEMKLDSLVVYPPVPYHNIDLESRKEDTVISIGRVVPSKGFEALSHVGPKVRKAKFILMGSLGRNGREIVSSISDSFERAGIQQNFAYLGWISDNEKSSLLGTSKVIFHPSVEEPFGIAILEGMANGAIPIVHNSGGPREFVPREWLFNSYDEAAEKIEIALKAWTPEVGKSMQEISSHFTEPNFERDFGRVIELLLKRKKKF